MPDRTTFEPVIGCEIHAELQTQSKMFCACPVVEVIEAQPNSAVCPICSGMPGTLPVINQRAVEFALRVALALECEIASLSIFARKNYFYPDLPKGYQISQYEQPLARNGKLKVRTSMGEVEIRIRRVHLEEDTGKLTHVVKENEAFSLVDLNRAGVSLLEIVSEPDMHSAEEVRAYAMAMRSLLRYLGVNSGDMQKGVLRIEPNISVRPRGSQGLGTRTEIKNLNSFRALERSVAFEIERQSQVLQSGQRVVQETRGWVEDKGETVTQRVKEEADDYRYFPEPDLPPLVIEPEWLDQIQAGLPELPDAKFRRFQAQYGLSAYDAEILTEERSVAEFFERTVQSAPEVPAKITANWISGDLFAFLNLAGMDIDRLKVGPTELAALVRMVWLGEISQASAKSVLVEMLASGRPAEQIVAKRGLAQISDERAIAGFVEQVLRGNPDQLNDYLEGKETIIRWLLGQVMQLTQGRANPQILNRVLKEKLAEWKMEGKRGQD
jgi:aspartyl-tRNA(Asn)/glutamyl-tRNA(Gln) amidotransferase subunit B